MRNNFKFRFWDTKNKIMNYCEWQNWVDYLSKFFIEYDEEIPNVKLMQATGLMDKNHNPIYEGDIVVLGFDENKEFPRVIEWHILGLRAKQINGDANFPIHYPFVGQSGYETDWEIIGNIYEDENLMPAKT